MPAGGAEGLQAAASGPSQWAMPNILRLAAFALFGLAAASAAADPPVRARAQQSLASYFSDEDYPEEAVRANEQGAVTFKLGVGPDGKPSSCSVTVSSGSANLDSTTCRVLMERSRFEPARDSKGKATDDEVAGRIVWRLPDDVPPREEAALMLWSSCILGEASKLALSDLPLQEIAGRAFPPCVALEAIFSRETGQPMAEQGQRMQMVKMLEDLLGRSREALKTPAGAESPPRPR